MTSPFGDPLDFLRQVTEPKPKTRSEELLSRQARREMCRDRGHRYQIRGKANPAGLVCQRCKVSWAIGPRTEPSED